MPLPNKFTIIIPPQDVAYAPGLLEKMADGDKESFAWVYKNYCKKVYDYAMLITNNKEISEDVVQEVFLKLWMHKEKLRGVEDFNGYLYVLYRNHVLDVLKDRKREITIKQDYSRSIASTQEGDENIFCKEQQQAVNKAVKQLPPQQQVVYKLSREWGWKREKIARELKLSEFTIKNHIQKALLSLRNNLTRELEI